VQDGWQGSLIRGGLVVSDILYALQCGVEMAVKGVLEGFQVQVC
jgi:hypothetical protein